MTNVAFSAPTIFYSSRTVFLSWRFWYNYWFCLTRCEMEMHDKKEWGWENYFLRFICLFSGCSLLFPLMCSFWDMKHQEVSSNQVSFLFLSPFSDNSGRLVIVYVTLGGRPELDSALCFWDVNSWLWLQLKVDCLSWYTDLYKDVYYLSLQETLIGVF